MLKIIIPENWAEKPPSPPMENFLALDLSISGNFEQLWSLWQKSPPQDEGKFFDTGSIHFRQFRTTLVFVAEKPPQMRENFLHWIYPFQAISSSFVFCGRKGPSPPHQMRENLLTLDLSISGKFWATLVFVAEKPSPSPPPPRWGKIFWHWIYQFQAISSIFDFVGEKPPCRWGKIYWHWIYPFQAISSNFGFCGRKAPPWDEGKFFDTGSIHFRQFRATLVFVAERPPPLFCLLMRDLTHVTLVEYLLWSPYYKSTLRFLLSEYLL